MNLMHLQPLRGWLNRHGWLTAGFFTVLLAALAYLPFIHELGIYRDDWHIIFGGRIWGSQVFPEMFSIDRPFIGFHFSLLYNILGEHVLNWHLAAFLLRVMGGLIFLLILRQIWPSQSNAAMMMSVLFVVYPGFLQQADAITYITHQIVLVFILFSLWMTVLAVHSTKTSLRILFYLLALGSTIYYLLVLEYVIGLEGLRLALMAYLIFRSTKNIRTQRKLKAVVLAYAPFALMIILFLVWRMFIFQSERVTVDVGSVFGAYLSDPLYQMLMMMVQTLQDFLEVAFSAWVVPFYNLSGEVRLKQQVVSLALGVLAAVLMAGFFWLGRNDPPTGEAAENQNWARHAIWLGAVGLLFAILPVVFSGRNVLYGSILNVAFDRYTLHAAPAAILLVGGILFYAFNSRLRILPFILLVGLSVTTQLNAGSIFANAWETTRQLWWQMSWRAPQIQPGTILLVGFATDTAVLEEYQVSYPANLIYYPNSTNTPIGAAPLIEVNAEKVIMGITEQRERRKVPITTDYDYSLVAYFPSSTACLHIVDGTLPVLSTGTDPLVQMIAAYSKIDQIDGESENHILPSEIFGVEPTHAWCYYFQKASLASQRGEWEQVVALDQEASSLDLKPVDPSEWLPFLVGYVNVSDYDNAYRIITYFKEIDFLQHQVCTNLERDGISRLIASEEGLEFLRVKLCQW
jgi:hypothetical protein